MLHEPVNYKKKYKTLKKKLRLLVYEQECFLQELRTSQKKLMHVTRDKSFLLDRLLQYEKVGEQSSDSDATASSDSEPETKEPVSKKKKTSHSAGVTGSLSAPNISHIAPGTSLLSNVSLSNRLSQQNILPGQSLLTVSGVPSKSGTTVSAATPKRGKVTKKTPAKVSQVKMITTVGGNQTLISQITSSAGHMTREELERHLEMKQSAKPTFMSLEKTPNSLPDDIFMN